MIGAQHQGKGYGAAAMRLVIDHVSSNQNATELLTSYTPGEGSPVGFYRKLGFQHRAGRSNEWRAGIAAQAEVKGRLWAGPCCRVESG